MEIDKDFLMVLVNLIKTSEIGRCLTCYNPMRNVHLLESKYFCPNGCDGNCRCNEYTDEEFLKILKSLYDYDKKFINDIENDFK